MSERRIIQPPEIVDADPKLIFLADPIQGAPDWQSVVASKIHDLDPTVIVASPRKDYEPGTFVYERQVDWETHFLRAAGRTGVIAFWLAAQTEETPGRAYAQTTRLELGEWKARHEHREAFITVGIEPGFGNERYIRHRFKQDIPDVKITDDIGELAANAVDLLPSLRGSLNYRKLDDRDTLVWAEDGTIENVVPNSPLPH